MDDPQQSATRATPSATSIDPERLRQQVEKSAELLPISGPITAFVFLNTLQAMEDLPFDQAIIQGAHLFSCQPYLSEKSYREKLVQGRIRQVDLRAVLENELQTECSKPVCALGTRFDFRMAMIEFPLHLGPLEEMQWFVAETDALSRMRPEVSPALRERFIHETRHWVMRDLRDDTTPSTSTLSGSRDLRSQVLLADILLQSGQAAVENWSQGEWEALSLQALWRVCRWGVHDVDVAAHQALPLTRHRDFLLDVTGEDSDRLTHEILIRFCAAYADQGMAHWLLPNRDAGFFQAFVELYRHRVGPPDRWIEGLSEELERIHRAGLGPLESLQESLEMLGVAADELEFFLSSTLLALRGWASMIRQMEVRSDRVPIPASAGVMIDFLAVRLILERFALAFVAKESLGYRGALSELRKQTREQLSAPNQQAVDEQRAFLLFQVAQILGWSPPALQKLSKADWKSLVAELEAFSGLERRRIFHLAFERRFRNQALDAIQTFGHTKPYRVSSPKFQAVFCIDAREESFRRHLEETCPQVETFGAAGFFGVPIYYKGVADAHFATLCPIVVRPQHWVIEEVVFSLEEENRRRALARQRLGSAALQVHIGSRSLAGGVLLTSGLGVLASIPLVARVMFPRITARIRKSASRFVEPPQVTRLRLERSEDPPGPDGGHIGFSLEEMANFGERLLRDIGLTENFARLVMFVGHGSFCLNNPHKSAYDCGACSGAAGGPNARTLAAFLNDPRVRNVLFRRGLDIPRDTVFLGGLHNTCNDSVTFFDLDQMPKSHLDDFREANSILEKTCERNAHERCRRFQSAPLDLSFEAAHRHVEGRSEDLAQTRPEFGNASNAMCFVGRRSRIRGLYLDRRSFMHSYDPTADDAESTILGRILGAVVPVCAGINLTYFFSYIDPPGWACGTKLPHNVTSLMGVMDGASSDMRLGLPWQGVEIHEPVRLLFVLETTPESILKIMDRNPVVGRILRNKWAQLAVLDPNSETVQLYQNGEFQAYHPEISELPRVDSSLAWYRGWREHLGFAVIHPDS